jgi:hypothetical protein
MEIARATSSGYIALNSLPQGGSTTFDGYNILSQMIQPINTYISNSMPVGQKKPESILFFHGINQFSLVYNGWSSGTIASVQTNSLTDFPNTETSDNVNFFYVLTRP